jgi:hypothetical protein
MPRYELFWGDTHTNLHLGSTHNDSPPELGANTNLSSEIVADLERSTEHAQRILDFWCIAYYPYRYVWDRGFRTETWRDPHEVDFAWGAVCETAEHHTREGEFVIFPGYEWQGNAEHGDHNVFYYGGHPPILRSSTLPQLYSEIRRLDDPAMAIPHHTGYLVGVRGKDWSVHDETISPFAEIYSKHGCSESDEELIGLRRNWHMGPGVTGGTIADGLEMGVRTGIIASNDSHHGIAAVHGWGLMGCYAEALTRRSLWEAFRAKRVYGVTGDRIELDFSVGGAPMGGEIEHRGTVRAEVRVRGSDAIDRIELLRNNRVIATHCHSGLWPVPEGNERISCKLRIEAGWGATPQDIPDFPPRDWDCAIELSDGSVLAAEPCWKTGGQWIGSLGGRRCEFGFHTVQNPPHDEVPSEATIFELTGTPSDVITIQLDGKTVTMTLTEAMSKSRIVDHMDEMGDYVRRAHGIDPQTLERRDWLYFCGHKVKIHRAIPECGFSASLEHVDTDPPPGVNHYRVRVSQRNGQMAWSSPIWVDNT